MNRTWRQSLFVIVFVLHPSVLNAQLDVTADYESLVPFRLLPLLHAPEVHDELQFSPQQVKALETLFREIDGEWFRARIMPPDKQREVNRELEQRVAKWLDEHATSEQRTRLQQLEYRAQGVRFILRSDIVEPLGLSPSQQEQFAELARASDDAQAKLQQAVRQGESTNDLESQVKKAAQAERQSLTQRLNEDQQKKLVELLGKRFDTETLARVYPMAPELVSVKQWLNSDPLTLQALRGKVVLLHFYAFQCHNCHANFDIYRRWHRELQEKGVVVLGIQTPETQAERRPDAVRKAAEEAQLEFPIMIDLQAANWQAWGNTMWPTVYVIDQEGYIRHWWQGELQWQGATGDKTIESIVDRLLSEATNE